MVRWAPWSTAPHRGIMTRRHVAWFPSGLWAGSEWQRPSKAQVEPQKLLKGWGLSLEAQQQHGQISSAMILASRPISIFAIPTADFR